MCVNVCECVCVYMRGERRFQINLQCPVLAKVASVLSVVNPELGLVLALNSVPAFCHLGAAALPPTSLATGWLKTIGFRRNFSGMDWSNGSGARFCCGYTKFQAHNLIWESIRAQT